MVIIRVTGLPNAVKMPGLIFSFRGILKGAVEQFWIRDVADIRGTAYKEASVEVNSYDDACIFQEIFDGHGFIDRRMYSVLSARIISEDSGRRRSASPHRRSRNSDWNRGHHSRDRQRSRSPLYRETSKLDLELELLRKQRLLIEEERRLLVEQKKLQLIKEFGASASREIEEMKISRDRKLRPIRRELKPTPRLREPQPGTLPNFFKPCKFILKDMSPIIQEKAEADERKLLADLIRSHLRKTLAIMLENERIIPADEILRIYRRKYPKSTDEEVVIRNLEQLRASHWLDSNKGNPTPPNKNQTAKKKTNAKAQGETKNTDSTIASGKNIKQEPIEDVIVKKEKNYETMQEDSKVPEKCEVTENPKMQEDSKVKENFKESKLQENPNVQKEIKLQENHKVQEGSKVQEVCIVQQNPKIKEESIVQQNPMEQVSKVQDNSEVQDARINEDSKIIEDIEMQEYESHETASPAGLQLLEAADDDWVEDGVDWDIDENSGEGSVKE